MDGLPVNVWGILIYHNIYLRTQEEQAREKIR
jgi:hypothetical protein